ncbi:MAG: methylmalonyl-CoA mutase, partial [Planctomycetota bacterium]
MTEPASPTASVPPVDRAAWRALVERDLKGRPYEEALVTRLLEGIELAPLYTEADGDASDARSGVPGLGSWTRGACPLGNTEGGWTVAVDAPPGAPQEVSAALQDDLAHGVSGINLALPEDEPSSRALLDGLLGGAPDAASLHLAPSADPAARGEQLFAAWARAGTPAAARKGNLGGDPFALLCDGVELPPSEVVWERLAAACRLAGERPGVRALELRADRYHEAGAHAAQELGLGIAAGIAALRGLDAAGLSPLHAARQLGFAFALDPDVFLGIAKLRAARRLWARVLSVLDAQGAGPAPLHARVGARCLTAYHPQGNLLRSTLATFAGAVGGAERITVLPHDAALAQPEAASRRLARNTQLVLLHEAHLHRVIDPAGGSYYVEVLTDRLSERSWEVVRAVEGQGGLRRALERGWVAERLAETRQRSSERVAHRVQAIVGVSVFP